MPQALAQEKLYTIEDIYALPEGERAELLDGQVYYMAPSSMKHQRLVMELAYQIKDYIRHNKGECEVFPAPFAVFFNENSNNYVEPDISVICDKDKITDKGCDGSPDWIIEVVSPGSRTMDYYKKLFKYRTAGVREYWIVDYERKLATVYDFEHSRAANYAFSDPIPVCIYPGFSINISGLKI